MLHAARLGFTDQLDCPEPQRGDGDGEPNTDRHTPHTLPEALDALLADTAMCDVMGDDLVRAFVALRRYELDRWASEGAAWNPDTIDDWELSAYLPYY
jgi:glutamine synthetase